MRQRYCDLSPTRLAGPDSLFERQNLAMQITPTNYGALTAMITPAIFMTANASLIISTSNRVARVVDRIRDLERPCRQARPRCDRARLLQHQRLEHGHDQMRRARTPQRPTPVCPGRATLYLAFTTFVGTSLTLAIDAMLQNWLVALAYAPGGHRRQTCFSSASVNLVLEALGALQQ